MTAEDTAAVDTGFFRFPHTPHLVWLGPDVPRDDKVLSPAEVQALLAGEVVVEEKLDGANLGFSLAPDGSLRVQNRGQYLIQPPGHHNSGHYNGHYGGQFARLSAWLAQHGDGLRGVLAPDILIFGEWCAARHSLDYGALPDWFLLFDVYDRQTGRFWCSSRRNGLAAEAGLARVPQLATGKFTVAGLKELLNARNSCFRPGPMEGVVIRRESGPWCEARAKLVRADFTQAMENHWRKRVIQWNRVQHHP